MISQIADAPASARGIELSELVSFLAHEVRGPLSVILGNALLLQRGRCGDEEARDGLEDIRQEAEKLRRITDGLFSLAQEAPEFEPWRLDSSWKRSSSFSGGGTLAVPSA